MKLEFIVFFFDVMLEEHFHTKRRMARILDIELRTLQYNFERIGTGKGGCIAIPHLLVYCCENGISIDRIFERFLERKRSDEEGEFIVMNHEGILGWLYHCALNKLFESDLRSMALALRVGERTLERALEQENGAESVLLFEQLMRYCMEHNISMDAMLAEYMGSRGE